MLRRQQQRPHRRLPWLRPLLLLPPSRALRRLMQLARAGWRLAAPGSPPDAGQLQMRSLSLLRLRLPRRSRLPLPRSSRRRRAQRRSTPRARAGRQQQPLPWRSPQRLQQPHLSRTPRRSQLRPWLRRPHAALRPLSPLAPARAKLAATT
jgi:hypothetical protein